MSSSMATIDPSSATNGASPSFDNKLSLLRSTDETHTSFCTSSPESTCSSDMNFSQAQTSISSTNRKEPAMKLPYPVLADHRDPSSVLSLLQKETQTTSKKILDVAKLIENCEKDLASNRLSDIDRKPLKYDRVQRKQQLDALKKHERRVNLQIDYMTTIIEIKGLEDEHKQLLNQDNSEKKKQIDILLRKLKQKLDQMKIYMRRRNNEMKKTSSEKQQTSTLVSDRRKQPSMDQKIPERSSSTNLNKKRPLSLTRNSHTDKNLKSTTNTSHKQTKPPIVRLASRSSSHQAKSQPVSAPVVRFLKKTTDSTNTTNNSTSPTTSASSSSTLSPPLIASTSTGDITNISKSSQQQQSIPSINDGGELNVEFDIDELFHDHPYSKKSAKRFRSDTRQFGLNQTIAKTES